MGRRFVLVSVSSITLALLGACGGGSGSSRATAGSTGLGSGSGSAAGPTTTSAASGQQSSGDLQPADVGSGQCTYLSFTDGSYVAQIAVANMTCQAATLVARHADAAAGASYNATYFTCRSTEEGPGSPWSSAWNGTYYAYTCRDGVHQTAFNWGRHYR